MASLRSDPARIRHFARARLQYRAVRSAGRLVVAALAVALTLRAVAYEPFNIPSQSMLPTLLSGDYLFVAKWPYGFSRYSLPLGLPLFDGRLGGSDPVRGDIVEFKTPGDNRTDFIKRVIGLPGDRVAMAHGVIAVNGVAVPRQRVDDFRMLAADDGDCREALDQRVTAPDGRVWCRVPQYVETLGSRRYAVLDQVADGQHDNFAPVTVPAGHYFVAGDNRDDSADSRLSIAEGGVGMVPAENLVGRADRVFFSIDELRHGRDALRLSRIGRAL